MSLKNNKGNTNPSPEPQARTPFKKPVSIEGITHIIVVGSGKGGVGKSTVALNLAVALSKQNLSVGVLDTDVYGPSLPRLTGTSNQKPRLQTKIIPHRRYGLSLMSMGHLVDEDSPLVWRGPMLSKTIDQLFQDVDWGELDVLILDLPPGTGDVALSVAQKIKVSGGIIVSTPQNLSLVDARKSVNMFKNIDIPLMGIVENMSYMRDEKGNKKDLFPRGQLDVYLEERKIKKLAEIPFHTHVGLSCEAGVPLLESYPDSEEGKAFTALAKAVRNELNL